MRSSYVRLGGSIIENVRFSRAPQETAWGTAQSAREPQAGPAPAQARPGQSWASPGPSWARPGRPGPGPSPGRANPATDAGFQPPRAHQMAVRRRWAAGRHNGLLAAAGHGQPQGGWQPSTVRAGDGLWLVAATNWWPASWRGQHLGYDWCGPGLAEAVRQGALSVCQVWPGPWPTRAPATVHTHMAQMYAYVFTDLGKCML